MRSPAPLFLFALLSVAGGPAVIAQAPTIGVANFYQVGQHYFRDSYDLSPLMAAELRNGGADHVWDLSFLAEGILYESDSIVVLPAPSAYTYLSEYYDTANVLINVYHSFDGYEQSVFLRENGRVRYVGGRPNGTFSSSEAVMMHYRDDQFAWAMEDGVTEGFAHTEAVNAFFQDLSGSGDHFERGEVTVMVDGAGSMIMPNGTAIPDVLRLRSIMTYRDSGSVFGVTDHVDTLFTWYAAGVEGPLATLPLGTYPMTDPYISPLPITVHRVTSSVGLADATSSTWHPHVWPQPLESDGTLVMDGAPGMKQVRLIDAAGRAVWSRTTASDRMPLDRSGLPPGCYAVQVRTADGRSGAVRLVVR